MKLALIGGGNMGGALLKAFVKSGILPAQQTLLIEPDQQKREMLVQETHCRAKADLDDEISGVDAILLAVKPQLASALMPQLKPFVTGDPLLISVMAGVSMKTLEEGLGIRKLVRVMPNTPALVGEGMSVFCASEAVTREGRDWVVRFLISCGLCLEVDDENAVDAATAVSSSTSRHNPQEMRNRTTQSRPSRVTASDAQKTLIPSPTRAGVFGITRTSLRIPNPSSRVFIETPAITEINNGSPVTKGLS
jgi:pyrroline-5-carboxylate reductase